MAQCPKCRAAVMELANRCPACGATLVATKAFSAPATPDAAPAAVLEDRETARARRRTHRLRSHALAGFILCFALSTVFGLPGSFLPGELFGNLIGAAVFGAPLGYLVSRSGGGVAKGAMIGCMIGMAYAFCILSWYGFHDVGVFSVVSGISYGLLPGALIGWHVDLDR